MVYSDNWIELTKKVNYLKTFGEAIETHMSWVFLTKDFAYKLKKPVSLPHLNLSSLEARRLNGTRELELNRSLASDHYLGLIALVKEKNGEFTLRENETGTGKVVDWLVKMKKVPKELMLDVILGDKKIPWHLIHQSADLLSLFYMEAVPSITVPQEYLNKLTNYVKENLNSLSLSRYELNQVLIDQIHHRQLQTLMTFSDAFCKRVDEGRIIQGHGDLRPEHICLTTPPIFIDRLEFSEDLRTLDPLDELTYLALECELMGSPDVGLIYLETYQKKTQDFVPNEILIFYKSLRATLRAKICLWHLDDERVTQKEVWKQKAQKYLNLAKVIL